MHFIVMDVIGKFKLLLQGQQSALTVLDMLMNDTWFIPLCGKEGDDMVHAYMANVYFKFCQSHQILSENGVEVKNKLFKQVACNLVIKWVFSPLYYPQGNGHIENVHIFFKACVQNISLLK